MVSLEVQLTYLNLAAAASATHGLSHGCNGPLAVQAAAVGVSAGTD